MRPTNGPLSIMSGFLSFSTKVPFAKYKQPVLMPKPNCDSCNNEYLLLSTGSSTGMAQKSQKCKPKSSQTFLFPLNHCCYF